MSLLRDNRPSLARAATPALSVALLALLLAVAPGCKTTSAASEGARLLDERRFDDALKAYARELKSTPDSKSAREGYDAARRAMASEHQLRAKKHVDAHELGDALRELEAAVHLDPDLEGARFELSRVRRERKLLARRLADAEATLEAGDCITARAELDAISAFTPTFPAIEERRVESIRRCYDRAMTLARLYCDLGNLDRCLKALDDAETYYPEHADVLALRKTANDRKVCRATLTQGQQQLETEDFLGAASLFQEVLDRCPDDPDAPLGLEAVRRNGVQASLAAGVRAVRAKDEIGALRAYETAATLLAPDAPDRKRLEALARHYRLRVAARQYVQGERAMAGGLPGAAMVRFRLADSLAGGFKDAATLATAAEGMARSELGLTVAVPPVENPTPFSWLGKRLGADLAKALREARELEGVTLRDGFGGQPRFAVLGKVETFDVQVPEPTLTKRPIDYKVGDRVTTHPVLASTLAAFLRAAAQGGADAAGARAALEAAPRSTRTPEMGRIELPVAGISVAGTARLSVRVVDRALGKDLARRKAEATYKVEEAVWRAFEPAGVKAHSGTLPKLDGVRRRLEVDVVAKALPEVTRALHEAVAGRFRLLADAGRGEEAIHYLALGLLAGGDAATRSEEGLRKQIGYRKDEKGYVLSGLSY